MNMTAPIHAEDGAPDQKRDFAKALEAFQSVVNNIPDGAANVVYQAYEKLCPAPQGQLYGSSEQKTRRDKFDPLSCKEGAPVEFVKPRYWSDAIDMYKRRTDDHKDETALLFDKECTHVRIWRHILETVKGAYEKTSAESNAAMAVEKALDGVQQHLYLPPGVRRPKPPLRVIGYYHGAVIREKGEWKMPAQVEYADYKGDSVFEMLSDATPQNLIESNIFALHYEDPNKIDITSICRDGTSKTFNRVHFEAIGSAKVKQRIRDIPRGAARFNLVEEPHITMFENEVLPELARLHPPQCKIVSGKAEGR